MAGAGAKRGLGSTVVEARGMGMVLLCMEDPASKTARRCRGFAPLLGLAAIA